MFENIESNTWDGIIIRKARGKEMKKAFCIALLLTTILCVGCSKESDKNSNHLKTKTTTESDKSSLTKEEASPKATSKEEESSDVSDNSNKVKETSESVTNTTKEDSTANSDTDNKEKADSLLVEDQVVIDGMTEDILNNMSLEEKVGQLFIVSFESLDSTKGSYYEWRDITKKMKSTLDKYHVGGVQFFSRNIETRDQTDKMIKDLQIASRVPLFIAVEEEGGDASLIGNNSNMGVSQFPNMEIVGDLDDKDYAYQVGETIGHDIRGLGFNLDFAPVADVQRQDENNALGSRAFGNDADKVSDMVSEVVKGLQSQYVAATLKYFPGEGDSNMDTANGAVNMDINLKTLRDIDFVPFKAGIKAGADVIMVSHSSISRVTENMVPSSLSSLVLQNILRTELGFDGVIMTDALNKKAITDYYSSGDAAVKAVKAGADILLMPEDLKVAYNSILNAVEKGTIKESRIDKSVRKILKLKLKRGIILSNTNLIEKDIE